VGWVGHDPVFLGRVGLISCLVDRDGSIPILRLVRRLADVRGGGRRARPTCHPPLWSLLPLFFVVFSPRLVLLRSSSFARPRLAPPTRSAPLAAAGSSGAACSLGHSQLLRRGLLPRSRLAPLAAAYRWLAAPHAHGAPVACLTSRPQPASSPSARPSSRPSARPQLADGAVLSVFWV